MTSTAATDHDDHEPHEHGLVEVTIQLEDEHIPALDEVAAELTKELKQPWDRGAVVRLALSEFFSNEGRSRKRNYRGG